MSRECFFILYSLKFGNNNRKQLERAHETIFKTRFSYNRQIGGDESEVYSNI